MSLLGYHTSIHTICDALIPMVVSMTSQLFLNMAVKCLWPWDSFNTLRPRQNGRHFADDMFKCIFLNENVSIPVEISLKFVPKGSINNNPALFQIMAWRRPGDKPLSEPMMVSSLTHICVTRPQWVKMNPATMSGILELPLLVILRFCVMQGFEIVGLIFFCTRMHYEYFLCCECASMFLTFVRRYLKYNRAINGITEPYLQSRDCNTYFVTLSLGLMSLELLQ